SAWRNDAFQIFLLTLTQSHANFHGRPKRVVRAGRNSHGYSCQDDGCRGPSLPGLGILRTFFHPWSGRQGCWPQEPLNAAFFLAVLACFFWLREKLLIFLGRQIRERGIKLP